VQFVSLADAGLDGTSAVGRMTLQLCAVLTEFERSLLRERTVAGLAAARARGGVVGRPRRELDLRAAHVLLGQGHAGPAAGGGRWWWRWTTTVLAEAP
jgi:DNA invertase Pin-like site-specific DNA recombinase